jgi:hypothetical protein
MAPHWRLHYCDAGGRQTASSSAEMIRAPVFEQPGHCHSVAGIPRRLLAMASAPRTTFVAPIYFQRSRYRANVFNLSNPSGRLRHMMARPARHPMIRNSMKRTKKIPNLGYSRSCTRNSAESESRCYYGDDQKDGCPIQHRCLLSTEVCQPALWLGRCSLASQVFISLSRNRGSKRYSLPPARRQPVAAPASAG